MPTGSDRRFDIQMMSEKSMQADPPGPMPADKGMPRTDAQAILSAAPGSDELRRRAQLISQSRKLEWIFSLARRTERSIEWCTFRHPKVSAVLLFTSQSGAKDYARHSRVNYQPVAMKAEDIPKNAKNWLSAGLTGFALNRCPRCSFVQTLEIQSILAAERLNTVWSITLAMQQWRIEKLIRLYLKDLEAPDARRHLEFLRDHVDCSNPYVHQLIALRGHREHDNSAVESSLERLAEFGPEYTLSSIGEDADGKPSDELEAERILRAERRLLATYGIPITP